MASQIEHSGVVDCVTGSAVRVKITSHSACGSCRAREACGLAESQEKIVEVAVPRPEEYVPGEAVVVGIRRRAGAVAVALAYGGALAVLLAALVLLIAVLGWPEGPAALVSLACVGGYYLLLWALRRKIEHTIQLTITKSND